MNHGQGWKGPNNVFSKLPAHKLTRFYKEIAKIQFTMLMIYGIDLDHHVGRSINNLLPLFGQFNLNEQS